MQKDFACLTATAMAANVLCRHLQSQQQPWQALLTDCGIQPDSLQQANARLPVCQLAELFAHAQERSQPRLGQAAAAAICLDDLHALGIVMRFSDTLFDACGSLATHFHWLIEGQQLSIQQHHSQIVIELHAAELVLHGSVLQSWLLHSIEQLISELGRSVSFPVQIESSRHQPTPAPVAERQRLVYPANVFFAPMPQRDRALRHHNLQLLDQQPVISANLRAAQQTRQAMHALLQQGQLSEHNLACQLDISVRTLQRRLQAAQTSYSTLLADVRKQQAGQLLRYSRLSIEQIANRLGFRETGNFSRAFRRWYGLPPSQYRQAGNSLSSSPEPV